MRLGRQPGDQAPTGDTNPPHRARDLNSLCARTTGKPLALRRHVHNAAVFEAALELFRCRSYSGAVAVCSSIIDQCPEHIALRLLLARSLLALRRDAEAQKQLSNCLEHEPRCAEAYYHLGELALRRDELKSAEIFLREARSISRTGWRP